MRSQWCLWEPVAVEFMDGGQCRRHLLRHVHEVGGGIGRRSGDPGRDDERFLGIRAGGNEVRDLRPECGDSFERGELSGHGIVSRRKGPNDDFGVAICGQEGEGVLAGGEDLEQLEFSVQQS